MFCKKGAIRNFAKFTGKHLCQAQMFSCEFCEISKNSLSYRTPLVAASAITVEEKYSPRILKDYFSLKIDPPIFTSTAKLLHRSNETSWHFPALKRLNHFLPQSTTSHRSDLSSEVNSICWHKSVASSRLDLRVLSPAYRNSRPEVFLRKLFWKYAVDLQENTHAEVWFQ